MTDTTDIKALRVEIAELRLEIAKGYDRFIPETKIQIKLMERILDQLEAERQRADDEAALNKHLDLAVRQNEGINNNLRRRAVRAEAELAALKGDQVPVAFTGSGSLDAIKGGHEGHIWGAPADAHPVPLYDRPQNPVVLPSPYYGDRHCLDKREVIAAIEAAGGIVKDGE